MSKFDLDPKALHDILKKKGIDKLYHANTVATSRLYLQHENLLSRQYVETENLYQTPQYTDDKDKKLGIYDDIFLDMVDIHDYLRTPNFYGPFLFVFSIDILLSGLVKTITITKTNPSNWNIGGNEEDCYYSDIDDFEKDYMVGDKINDVGKMIIIKDVNGRLPLLPYCTKFILDNPNIHVENENETLYLVEVVKTYFESLFSNDIYNLIEKVIRHKNAIMVCSCWRKYKLKFNRDMPDFRRLFHKTP